MQIVWNKSCPLSATIDLITTANNLFVSSQSIAGLFHRSYMMSGSAYSSWALVDDPVHYAVQLATSLNCSVPR